MLTNTALYVLHVRRSSIERLDISHSKEVFMFVEWVCRLHIYVKICVYQSVDSELKFDGHIQGRVKLIRAPLLLARGLGPS